jgi:dephospho-CoA kinase
LFASTAIEAINAAQSANFRTAQARINSQMPIQEKCDRADVILDNSFYTRSIT